ncbi:MAG: endonuclease V [Deltaproteobacteria bacterium]|nr:endonuclease V [Deltaproteobacteria bacterium]MBW1953600.1 endonuclease V [Deltaproteobacteria bacterium]MBW1986762.1 endonuclease V [Deltaproteobacteria bacterium]MBW2135266.1 endonuclease V [Deltaproteobacteria bacterium]
MLSSNWPSNYQEAVACQKACQDKVRLIPLATPPRLVAGVDVAYDKVGPALYGAVVVMTLPDLEIVEAVGATGEQQFPYIPGLLSFREIPILISALKKVRQRPDVILVDGQGVAHPRGLGLASHLGVLLRRPTIGCAKSRLIGKANEPGMEKGSISPLEWEGQVIGLVLRSRRSCKPLYLSPGNLITLEETLQVVLKCLDKYRLPLPLREAHLLSQRLRAGSAGPD